MRNAVLLICIGLVLPLTSNASMQSSATVGKTESIAPQERSLRNYQQSMEDALAEFWISVNALHDEAAYKVRCRNPNRKLSDPKIRWWTYNRHAGCLPNYVFTARTEILRDTTRIGIAHNLNAKQLNREKDKFLAFVEQLSEVHPIVWEKLDLYLAAKAEYEQAHLQRYDRLPKFNRLTAIL